MNEAVERERQALAEASAEQRRQLLAAMAKQRDEQALEAETNRSLAVIAAKFVRWARASRIKPEVRHEEFPPGRFKRRKGWNVLTVSDSWSNPDSRSGHDGYSASLFILTDGSLKWLGDSWRVGTAITPAILEQHIAKFIAKSNSRVPWPS